MPTAKSLATIWATHWARFWEMLWEKLRAMPSERLRAMRWERVKVTLKAILRAAHLDSHWV